jgi:hypothetical protein
MAFGVLEQLLTRPGCRLDRTLKPIVFELLPDGVFRWSIDPRRSGSPVVRQDTPDAALRIRCSEQLLLALFSPQKPLVDLKTFTVKGDLSCLDALAKSMESIPQLWS